jgi:hypothetical protein
MPLHSRRLLAGQQLSPPYRHVPWMCGCESSITRRIGAMARLSAAASTRRAATGSRSWTPTASSTSTRSPSSRHSPAATTSSPDSASSATIRFSACCSARPSTRSPSSSSASGYATSTAASSSSAPTSCAASIPRLPALLITEILALAHRQGATLFEVRVNHYPRPAGEQSGGSLRVVLRSLDEMLRLRRRLHTLPRASRGRIVDTHAH